MSTAFRIDAVLVFRRLCLLPVSLPQFPWHPPSFSLSIQRRLCCTRLRDSFFRSDSCFFCCLFFVPFFYLPRCVFFLPAPFPLSGAIKAVFFLLIDEVYGRVCCGLTVILNCPDVSCTSFPYSLFFLIAFHAEWG